MTENVDPVYKPYWDAVGNAWSEIMWMKSIDPQKAVEILKKHLQQQGLPTDWLEIDTSEEAAKEFLFPEDGEGEELARPGRYSVLVQKLLFASIVLGEMQREEGGVDRRLYRALRGLVVGPLSIGGWYPLVAGWFEVLERGERRSPLTVLLRRIPAGPRYKAEALRFLRVIEEGVPPGRVSSGEREAFLRAVEEIKREVWASPGRIGGAVVGEVLSGGVGLGEAVRAVIGLLHDLAQVHAGVWTPGQVGISPRCDPGVPRC